MNPQFWWFVSRASGIVAWALLCGAVMWGMFLSTRILRKIDRPAWLLDLHKWLAALSVIAVAIHLAGLVADSYVEFGWRELSVPMASTWEPGAVTWGILATYLLVAIQATSLVTRFLPRRLWRLVHLTSYAMFLMTTVHTFAAGTDASNDLFQVFGASLFTLVAALTVLRVMYAIRDRSPASATPPSAASAPIDS